MPSLFDGSSVSKIGLGTWQLGMKGWGPGYEEKELIEALRFGIESGLNFIDTAEIYGMGRSEKLVGEAVGIFDRKRFFIATKLAGFNANARRVKKSLSNSLERLKLDYIDLYQVHWEPSIYTSIPELFKELERAVKEGLIGHIGVSNFSVKSLQKANDSMKEQRVESNQIKFNVVERPSPSIIEFMKQNNIKLIAWSPLAQGFLSGKYSSTNRPTGGVRKINKLFSPSYLQKFNGLLSEFQRISSGRGVGIIPVVLAYEKHLGVLPIPGFRNSKQVSDIVSANSLNLTQQEINSIETALREAGTLVTSTGFYPKLLPNFIARLGFLFI
jgi:aryl-alcohol dehydrogenase-like predicted oxidoreductase